MTYEDPTQVVVIEEQRRRRGALPWIAGGAVIALLASGGTFALWRASADFTGGQVIAGDLDVSGCSDLVWYDISPDRTDKTVNLSTVLPGIDFTKSALLATSGTGSIYAKALSAAPGYSATYPSAYTTYLNAGTVWGHLIDNPATWRMVPGDTVIATCGGSDPALITLEGDNLVAALELVDSTGVAVAIDFQGHNGVVGGAETFIQKTMYPTSGALGYYGAPNAGQLQGTPVETGVALELKAYQADGVTPAAYTTPPASNAKDLRSAAALASDGRMSLGQEKVYPMFVIHFIDDGIEGPVFACYDDDDDSVISAYTDSVACLADASTLAVGDTYWAQATGYTGVGTGDVGVANGRYLATPEGNAGHVLASIASGNLVLRQVRSGAGAFTGVATPVPTGIVGDTAVAGEVNFAGLVGAQVANLAGLTALGALGQTAAWHAGAYVVLGDASMARWNGSFWVAYTAP